METKNGKQAFYAKTKQEWREWLDKNHRSEGSVWLILYHKKSNTASVYYDEAVEEALCYGWVDSKSVKRDDESYYLYFAKRKPNSNWSKPNRIRVEKMIKQGLMTPSGQELIDLAKKTGTWEALKDIEDLIIPEDLQILFVKNNVAYENFKAFPSSSKRIILEWIMRAKKPETRQKRIVEVVELAAQNIKANHPTRENR